MFVIVCAAYAGGALALAALWSYGWLIAFAVAPLAGSGAAFIALLLMGLGQRSMPSDHHSVVTVPSVGVLTKP